MLLKDLNDFDANAQPGDWAFLNNDTYSAIRLHEGEFGVCILPILKVGERWTGKPITAKPWDWNGSKDNPTLTPSILHWGNGRNQPATWHGYLTDGKLVKV